MIKPAPIVHQSDEWSSFAIECLVQDAKKNLHVAIDNVRLIEIHPDWNPFHMSCFRGDVFGCVAFIILRGDPNLQTSDGETGLDMMSPSISDTHRFLNACARSSQRSCHRREKPSVSRPKRRLRLPRNARRIGSGSCGIARTRRTGQTPPLFNQQQLKSRSTIKSRSQRWRR